MVKISQTQQREGCEWGQQRIGWGGNKFGQGKETMANKRGGEGLGGGRWGSSREKMGCDEWR